MSILRNFLICLVGLPASGKSTFAEILKERLSDRFKDRTVICVDPDLIRKSLTNNDFDPEKEKIVRENNLSKISNALKEGKIVISDDLNYYTSMRHDLKNIADALSLHFFIIHITTPISTCLKWNEKRGRKIPDELIKKTYERFDYFDKYQWDRPFQEVDLSNTIDVKQSVNEIISKIISILKDANFKNVKEYDQKVSSNINHERLETITRQTVGMLLKNSKNLSIKDDMLKLRKKFIKLNLNLSLTESEITKKLIEFLEVGLNKKLS